MLRHSKMKSMKTLIRSGLLAFTIPLMITACSSNQAERNSGSTTTADSSLSDTSIMDTSMKTGTGTDTLNPGIEDTGRPNTDATHR